MFLRIGSSLLLVVCNALFDVLFTVCSRLFVDIVCRLPFLFAGCCRLFGVRSLMPGVWWLQIVVCYMWCAVHRILNVRCWFVWSL